MIFIRFFRDEKYLIGFEIKGHAEFKNGRKVIEDKIICSSVSMLAQSTLYGIGEVLKYSPKYEVENGFVKCDISDFNEEHKINCQVLLKTMEVTVYKLLEEESYNKYITLMD